MTLRISNTARKSVTIVADKRNGNEYVSGCIMVKDEAAMSISVIASSDFVKGRQSHLKVVFFDKAELNARVIAVEGAFCLLKTPFHPSCAAADLLEDKESFEPMTTFMFTPISQTVNLKMSSHHILESVKKMSGSAFLETTESYRKNGAVLVDKSTNCFMVSCAFFEKTPGRVNRLIAALVFTTLGKTAGIVLQNCREDPMGAQVKVALKATHLREMMKLLDPPAPRKKRKRC